MLALFFIKEITSEDILLYLLGGEERLAKIREMFQNCYYNKIGFNREKEFEKV